MPESISTMVTIQRNASNQKQLKRIGVVALTILVTVVFVLLGRKAPSSSSDNSLRKENLRPLDPSAAKDIVAAAAPTESGDSNTPCPYRKISDLAEAELHPKEGKRHMITPPAGGPLSLVCCQTTKGPLSIAVHTKWAPNGAQRFLEMVKSGYFNSGVPMMRCVKNFLCQFGLAGGISKTYKATIPDDPNWLPEGLKFRENEKGVKRFAKGYMAYAGGGPNSRDNQFIVSLKGVGPLAGGSPWEVPWGELIGQHSFVTLSQIYTGYDEKGPPQGMLWKEGAIEEVKVKWPLLDYITSCNLLDHVDDV